MPTPLYDCDFAAWAETNAGRLRAGDFEHADMGHIAEELESLSRSQRVALRSHAITIMEHLLKLTLNTASPILDYNWRVWRMSIVRARQKMEDELDASPSLQSMFTPELLQKCYERAARYFLMEEYPGILPVPAACPWTWEEVRRREYWLGKTEEERNAK